MPIAEKYNIDIIPLITLTSGHRIEKIAKSASGFIYVVSSLGITGERNEFFNGLKDLVANIKQYTDVPTAIGFGVHTPEQARTMAEIADGVIIGSAIVDIVAKEKQQAPAAVGKFTKQIREAVNSVKQVPVK
ncbi:Tryptophan synthase alpha chain [Lactobacillus helveticus]|uniref:tryptophan synthase n=1 Tax=Lactobacillus helveticus TaxID=1587 RepID=A0A9Q5BWQ4_LACHE|nr:Tryptophan synthase alpha chain [Lactobacillus helveticus]NRN92362.1 Tryptophan synthase alpha chain [Lactobacillus helveticus]NRO15360.1 Tryptophan synthase alpha chain [Lactobacillus helveticus]NRO53365.1 Tryptophan synthase alpha chain [Lactobacillus helveticus]